MDNNPINPTEQPEQDTSASFVSGELTAEEPAQAAGSTPETTPVETPKKKSRIGRIIIICVLALVLIGGVVAGILYMNWRNSDEVVLLESVTDSIDLRAAEIKGSLDIKFNDDGYSLIKSIVLTETAKTAGIPSSSDSQLIVTLTDDTEITLDIASIILSDGAIYIKIDGISDTLDLAELGLEDLDEEYAEAIEFLEDIIARVDGQWLKFDWDELADSELAGEVGDIDLDTNRCLIGAIENLNSDESRSDLISLYKDHTFLEVTKKADKAVDGYTDFEVVSKRAELIEFLNAAQTKPLFTEFTKCSEDIEAHTFTNGDFDSEDGFTTSSLVLGINTSKREIGRFTFTGATEDMTIDMQFEIIERLDTVEVSAPADAVSFIELAEDILEAYMELFFQPYYDDVDYYDYLYQFDE